MMTLARELTISILNAQARIDTVATRTKDELQKQRDELRSLCKMPAELEQLKQQYSELTGLIDIAKRKTTSLRLQRDETEARLNVFLQEVSDRLHAIYAARLEESHLQRVNQELNDCINAFSVELKNLGVETEKASPAQLIRQIARLAPIAAAMRERAMSEVKSASEILEKGGESTRKYNSLQEEQRQLERRWQELYDLLQQHYRLGDIGIFNDLKTIDPQISRRIRQEILAPKLNDARIEREKGLTSSDPLQELRPLE